MRDKLGSTGDFPRGKLNPTDEGGLKMSISHEAGTVRIDFGEQVAWLAMSPDEALTFASVIVSHAVALKRAS